MKNLLGKIVAAAVVVSALAFAGCAQNGMMSGASNSCHQTAAPMPVYTKAEGMHKYVK